MTPRVVYESTTGRLTNPTEPMTLRTTLLSACLLVLSGCAAGPGRPGGPHETRASLLADFKKADTNGDEQLSREEMSAGLPRYAADFDEIDIDHNGLVNFAELWSYWQWRHLGTDDRARTQNPHNKH